MAARASTGTYTATSNSFNPAVTGTTIDAGAWNAIRTELEVEITDSLNRSGKGGMLADLDMSSNNIINLASASAAHHAVRFDQLTDLSASLASQVAVLSALHGTLSAAHTTLSAAHTTLSAAHTTLSAEHVSLSAAHTTLSAAHTTLSAAFTVLSANFAQRDYLVLSAGSALVNERVFTAGDGLSANDAGAGNAFTISMKPYTYDQGTGGTIGGVPVAAAGDATANKFLKADGTWASPAGSGDMQSSDAMSAGSYWAASADRWMEPSATWAAADVQTLADAATVTVNFSLGINFKVTLGGNRALLPKNAKSGQSGAIYVSQSGGARTLSCNPIFKWEGGTFPGLSTSLSTASGAWDVITYSVLSANFVTSSILKNVK